MGNIKLIGCLWHPTGSHCKCLSWNNPSQDYMEWWMKSVVMFIWYVVHTSYCLQIKKGWLLLISCWIAILCMKQWQAVVIPLSLTSLMYAGSLVLKSLLLLDSWKDKWNHGESISCDSVEDIVRKSTIWMKSVSSNIMVWRNFIVVSILPYCYISLLSNLLLSYNVFLEANIIPHD